MGTFDILKSLELYESHEKYVKKPGEDLNSVITGLLATERESIITFCNQITKKIWLSIMDCTNNEYNKKVATLFDKRIIDAYVLNNYIAHMIWDTDTEYYLSGTNILKVRKKIFSIIWKSWINLIRWAGYLKRYLLGIYANQLENKTRI